MTDARGNSLIYQYDTAGNLQSIIFPDGSIERFESDDAGNLTSTTSRRSQGVGYEYDARGLVTRQTFADGSQIDFTYDDHGNLLSATDASGTTKLVWGAADRMSKITYPTGRFLEYTYDAGNRRMRMVDQDGFTINYAYDAVGRLAVLTDANDEPIVTYTYDDSGRLGRKENGNGTFTTYSYGSSGELLHLVNYAAAGDISSRFDYAYDDLGRRVEMGTLDGVWTYNYDSVGQLIHAVFVSTDPTSFPPKISHTNTTPSAIASVLSRMA